MKDSTGQVPAITVHPDGMLRLEAAVGVEVVVAASSALSVHPADLALTAFTLLSLHTTLSVDHCFTSPPTLAPPSPWPPNHLLGPCPPSSLALVSAPAHHGDSVKGSQDPGTLQSALPRTVRTVPCGRCGSGQLVTFPGFAGPPPGELLRRPLPSGARAGRSTKNNGGRATQ